MTQFIEECRREWKRLRVPDPVADEMAADLAADLEEAAAEGVSQEEVLGSGASDARSFAATWAAERAVIPPRPLTARLRRRSLVAAAIAALTIIAAVGAALVIFASPRVSAPAAVYDLPPPPPHPVTVTLLRRTVAPMGGSHAIWVTFSTRPRSSGVDIHRGGSILLIVGIVGAILSMPFLFWSSRRFDTAQS